MTANHMYVVLIAYDIPMTTVMQDTAHGTPLQNDIAFHLANTRGL